jgi:hypothetical protein
MAAGSVIDLQGPGPFDLGLSHLASVAVSPDRQHLQFEFLFQVRRGDSTDEVAIQIAMTAERAMGLLLALQETQRIERFPLPEVPVLTTIDRKRET